MLCFRDLTGGTVSQKWRYKHRSALGCTHSSFKGGGERMYASSFTELKMPLDIVLSWL